MAGNRAAVPRGGWLTFAAVIMFIVGFHNLIYGIASLRDYTVIVNNLTTGDVNVLYADRNFWGWLFIFIGIVEMAIAFGVYARNEAARWAGVVIASINAIGQLAYLAAFPVWSVVIIAIDVLVIYALLTHEFAPAGGGHGQPYPSDRPGVGAPAGRAAGVGRPTEHATAAPGGSGAAAGGRPAAGGSAEPPGYGGPPGYDAPGPDAPTGYGQHGEGRPSR
ncbi:DUF7144 domain-containing protein [Frankia sp. AiPs1]|uniref:DUF7144 family membrane protein n=1 Tax=Frankia sp. AiPa1 TaxID=573492 RepID=UPI00202AC674|nr:hypothetical protein [Frankia sp. AiPa1]MCL9757841.1 hypothetical protein [Frankia sp. AiPa1]